MRKRVRILAVASLLLPMVAAAGQLNSAVAAVARQVPDRAFQAQVLVTGETHGKARSHALAWALIQRALTYHDCVNLALEIPSDGRSAWRSVADHPEAIDRIGISPIHDSPSLRYFMTRTAELAKRTCLGLYPIDEPNGHAVEEQSRDEYMAHQLKRLAKEGRFVIALVGSLHAVRHLDWKHGLEGKPLAGLLMDSGLSLYVLVQDWIAAIDKPHIFTRDSDAAIEAMNKLHWFADILPATSLHRYADMLVQWPEIGKN